MLWVSLSEKHGPNSALPVSKKSLLIPASISGQSAWLLFCMLKKGWDDNRNTLKTLRFHIVLKYAGFRGAEEESI